MRKYDICYGYLSNPLNDTSMWMYMNAENMADMIRRLVRYYSNELNFRIIDLTEQRATLYIPAADVNQDGEFRRIYSYGVAWEAL